MKYIQLFELFGRKKKEEESNFKGKKSTYLYDDIQNKDGERVGTCKKCGKVVNMVSHEPSINGKDCTEKTIFD